MIITNKLCNYLVMFNIFSHGLRQKLQTFLFWFEFVRKVLGHFGFFNVLMAIATLCDRCYNEFSQLHWSRKCIRYLLV